MDQELITYLEARFGGLERQITDLREETRTSVRQTHVMLEGLRSDLHMVAEGVMAGSETLAAFKAEVGRRFNDLEQRIGAPFYRELSERVHHLEEWVETKN
jgi:hypothetical protein